MDRKKTGKKPRWREGKMDDQMEGKNEAIIDEWTIEGWGERKER